MCIPRKLCHSLKSHETTRLEQVAPLRIFILPISSFIIISFYLGNNNWFPFLTRKYRQNMHGFQTFHWFFEYIKYMRLRTSVCILLITNSLYRAVHIVYVGSFIQVPQVPNLVQWIFSVDWICCFISYSPNFANE